MTQGSEYREPIIVVGVSGRTGSPNALRWALDVAARVDGRVRAVLAWRPPRPPAAPGMHPPAVARTGPEDPAQDARDRLTALVRAALSDSKPGGPALLESSALDSSAPDSPAPDSSALDSPAPGGPAQDSSAPADSVPGGSARGDDHRIECVVEEGGPVRVLLRASRHADLLVIDSPRQEKLTGLSGKLVAPRLIYRAACPVVVMPASGRGPSGLRRLAAAVADSAGRAGRPGLPPMTGTGR